MNSSVQSADFLKKLIDSPLPELDQVEMALFSLPLKSAFETSFGSIDHRDFLITIVRGEGIEGYGECVADADPLYSSETTFTCRYILQQFLIPMLGSCRTIGEYLAHSCAIRGHNMAKATLEASLWDALAKSRNTPLFRLWGGEKERIGCGVSVGIQKDKHALVENIRAYLADGYQRIKIKIKPGKDYDLLSTIRSKFPELPLMADANAAYTLDDIQLLRSLDQFQLMMIEQPLHFEDLYDHALLQKQIQTPICLDESIISSRAANAALQLKSCRIINIKTGRVGGHTESIRIHNLAAQSDIPVWCGGMLESGIGRAHNLALASLPNFKLPGDTSASKRYWEKDIIQPEVEMDREGFVRLPEKPGMGYEVDKQHLNQLITDRQIISL